LGNVENTALSTWGGSSNITTLGTIGTGTWNATAIAWAKVDKTGSNLTDLATRNYSDLQNIPSSFTPSVHDHVSVGGSLDVAAIGTGIFGSARGGTGNGFTKFSGPATSEKTFTLPNASDTVACLGHVQSWTAKQTFTKATVHTPVILTDAATIATDASLGNRFRVTLGDNRTLGAPSNPTDGQQIVYEVIQDGTGTRTLALATGAGGFAFGSDITGITLSTGGNVRDYLTCIYNSAQDRWAVVGFIKGYLT
jgi:hypothetical protein